MSSNFVHGHRPALDTDTGDVYKKSGTTWARVYQHYTSSTTAARPTVTATGYLHWDITLGKPVWWNGTVWKDATGTTV